MKITTIANPSKPAARLSFTDSAPSVAPTCVTARTSRSTGRDPELMPVARSLALCCVKLPEICALPPAISCWVTASTSSLPQVTVEEGRQAAL